MRRRSAAEKSRAVERAKRFLLLAGLLLVMTAPAGAEGPAAPPRAATTTAAPVIGASVSTFTLPNGLTVVVIPDHRAPVVTHMVWYKAGSADEPAGKSGIAHYLEHLMFKGTKANPDGAFSKKVADIGGQENAFTSYDYTAYYQRVAKEHLPAMMALEADRMQNLAFDPKQAEPELAVVLEERSMRTDNDPSARLGEAVDAALHRNHPYRIPVIGWKHELEKLTPADAFAFYDRFYTPNNAILVVAGDVEEKQVRDLALDTYGRVPRRAEPGRRLRPKDPDLAAVARVVSLADERVTQPSYRRVWEVPSERTALPGESEALDILADVLGGGATSRLYRTLVAEKGLAADIGAYYQSDSLDEGRFVVVATPRDGVSLADLGKAIDAVIAGLTSEGPSAAEVERAGKKVLAAAIRAQDSQATLARIFGQALATDGTIDSVRFWPSRIREVTAGDVKTVAERRLVPEQSVVGLLESAPPSGKPVARPPGPGSSFGAGPSGHIRHSEAAPMPGLPAAPGL